MSGISLKRKVRDRLLEWKERSRGSTALMVNGARRVGKSYTCIEFARTEYASSIIIDFNNMSPVVRDIFENDSYDLDRFFFRISAFYKVKLHERDTVFVFDEVQMYPKARALIKYLVADGRYDYIETGSLLSIRTNVKDIVIPSEEEGIDMFPLDFEEFLWAMGDPATMDVVRDSFDRLAPIGEAFHRNIMGTFRTYMMVGGMPQAVLKFIESRDLNDVERVKRGILDLYRKDIAKFAGGDGPKVRGIFDKIPSQLAKKEKRFVLSALGRNARLREFGDAFFWLYDSMIVNVCANASDPSYGLVMSEDDHRVKCYMGDTGLLVTQSMGLDMNEDPDIQRMILFDRIGLNEGMFMENIVAQAFRSQGIGLFFYSRSGSGSKDRIEIDFLIRRGGKVCPVEVKSSSFARHVSLDKYRARFGERVGQPYILYQNDLMVRDGIVHLPLYMAMLL
ncbi:ATP-binding protein [Candidatus Methanoprimaticola sp. MG2]|uniref:ATP-binding protein n=1 Tax=Candidatus Methanoprimaticola sp. MG2 TaxID=3228838 RepID=UPI0039C6D14D